MNMGFTPRNEADRRGRRAKGLIAGLAGIALLLGGSTFAYWSQSESVGIGQLENGNLELSGVSTEIFDTTGTRTKITADNFTKWVFVPGDTFEIDLSATVNLSGDHMKADLTLATPNLSADDALKGWAFSYKIIHGSTETSGTLDKTTLTGSPIDVAKGLTPTTVATGADYKVIVTGQLLHGSDVDDERHFTGATLDLSDIKLNLVQVYA